MFVAQFAYKHTAVKALSNQLEAQLKAFDRHLAAFYVVFSVITDRFNHFKQNLETSSGFLNRYYLQSANLFLRFTTTTDFRMIVPRSREKLKTSAHLVYQTCILNTQQSATLCFFSRCWPPKLWRFCRSRAVR